MGRGANVGWSETSHFSERPAHEELRCLGVNKEADDSKRSQPGIKMSGGLKVFVRKTI